MNGGPIPLATLYMALRIFDVALLSIFIAAIVVIAHGWFRDRFDRPRMDAARRSLNLLLSGSASPGDERPLRELPLRLQVELFSEIAPLLARDSALMSVISAKDLARRAQGLTRSRLWWRRLHGIRILTVLGQTIELCPDWFTDRHLEVRAQAAEWAAEVKKLDALPILVEMLADPVGLCRFAVQDSLQRMGNISDAALAHFISRANNRGLAAALEIAATFQSSAVMSAVLQHAGDPSPHVRKLVAHALGSFGGAEVVEAIQRLLGDENAGVRTAAAQSAGKLKIVKQARRLFDLLSDSSWEVRKAAASSLYLLGAPGILLLRSAAASPDRFARDMASQVLQVAALEGQAG